MVRPFHIAVPVSDLSEARRFYGDLLGCNEGRSASEWVDFNLYGHQVVAHLSDDLPEATPCGSVDGVHVPVPHFGVVLDRNEWTKLANRLRHANVRFVVEPQVRYVGHVGEQATLFFMDPFGNALEFKSMSNDDELFASGS